MCKVRGYLLKNEDDLEENDPEEIAVFKPFEEMCGMYLGMPGAIEILDEKYLMPQHDGKYEEPSSCLRGLLIDIRDGKMTPRDAFVRWWLLVHGYPTE